jgi:hypothetical protein
LKGIVEMKDFKSTKLKAKVIEMIEICQKIVAQENNYENRVILMVVINLGSVWLNTKVKIN